MTALIKWLLIFAVFTAVLFAVSPNQSYVTVGKTENPQSVGIHTIHTEKDRQCIGACQVIMTGVALEILGVNVSGTVRSIGKKVLDIIL